MMGLKNERRKQFLLSLVCLGAGLVSSCDLVELTKEKITSTHRQSAQGRVGVLRALQVHDRSAAMARRLSRRGDERCRLNLEGPFEARIQIDAEIIDPRRNDEVIDRFTEIRRVSSDPRGNVLVRHTIAYMDPSGRKGETSREVRLVGPRRFVREQNLPFVSHPRHRGQTEALLRDSMDAIPASLSTAGESWRPHSDNVEDTFIADIEQSLNGVGFDCGMDKTGKAWLQRFLHVARLNFAEAYLPATKQNSRIRTVSARFLAGDPDKSLVVRLDVEEKVNYREPTPVVAPEEVASLRKDRPFNDIERILSKKLGLSQWNE